MKNNVLFSVQADLSREYVIAHDFANLYMNGAVKELNEKVVGQEVALRTSVVWLPWEVNQ